MDLGGSSDDAPYRTDTNDSSFNFLIHHVAGDGLGAKKDSLQIDGMHPIPNVFSDLEKLEHWTDPSVIHKDVDVAEMLQGRVNHPPYGSRVCYITFHQESIDSAFPDERARLLRRA